MPDTKHIALVLGASGLIGKETLNLLLENNKYKTVYAITRKSLGITHPKLTEIIADMSTVDEALKELQVDHLYSAIGSTKSKTPDKKQYYEIDLDYPLKVAKSLHQNGCNTVCLVSSMGADAYSSNFYLELKGKVEEAMQAVGFRSVHLFRPSLLLGKRKEKRFFEQLGQVLFPVISFLFIGKLKDYKGIQAKDVASAMVNVATQGNTGVYIYQTQLIKELA